MRTITLAALVLLTSAAPALAQDPPSIPAPADPVSIGRSEFTGKWYGTVDFGGRVSTVDGDEARFQRYRDLRSGIYANNAVIGRRTEDWALEAQAWNIGYRDQRYQVDLQRVGRMTASFLWDQIPLFISGDTRTLYTEVSPGVFRLDDAMQQRIQAGQATLHNYTDQAVPFDLKTMRKIGLANVVFNATPNTDLAVVIRSTDREGYIPYGGTFGFSNAVEIPMPLDSQTTDLTTTLEWGNDRGMLRLGWDGSSYENQLNSVIWENPLRYGPDASGQPTQGRMSSWPSNTLTYLHGTGTVSLPMRGRATGYVAFGQARNSTTLLPFTINTALAPPPMARATADAESQMAIANLTLALRPASRMSLNARYRYSDVDVDTVPFDRSRGSVNYDSSAVASADPSAYHSVKRSSFDVDAAFAVAPFTSLKVGYSNLTSDYTHRIFEQTAEDVLRVSLDTTGHQRIGLRAQYETRQRTGEGFDPEELAHVSEIPSMRHYDIADRNRDRFTFIVTALATDILELNASAGIGRDEYPESGHGLQFYDTDQYSVGASLAPGDRYNLWASYGWDNYSSNQRSRNSSDAAQQADPRRDWTTDYTGKVNFLEAGLDLNDVIARSLVRISADWNRSNDTYLYGLVTGSPLAVPEQLPPVKNELFRGEVDFSYDLGRNLRLGLAYWFENYDVEDFALGPETISGIAFPPVQEGAAPTTNALLLGYQYRPYTAHVGFVRLTYGF